MKQSRQVKKVNLFILGVQKAGTTALGTFLAKHPDICLVEGKEAHVFDDPDYLYADDRRSFADEKFRQKLSHYAGEQFICDATPITLFHPFFLTECVNYNPGAKFIVLLRDPVARAFSHYHMTRSRGLEPYSPLLAFLCEPWRMRGIGKGLPGTPFQHRFRDFSYLSRGRYRSQLKTLTSLIADEQLLIMQQETLIQHHKSAMDEVFSFLGVSHCDVPQERVFEGRYEKTLSPLAEGVARLYFRLFR